MLQRQIKDLILSLTCDVKQEGFSAGIHLDRQLPQYSPGGDSTMDRPLIGCCRRGCPQMRIRSSVGSSRMDREWNSTRELARGIRNRNQRCHRSPAQVVAQLLRALSVYQARVVLAKFRTTWILFPGRALCIYVESYSCLRSLDVHTG